MNAYSTWTRARLIKRIEFLKPYRKGLHRLAKQITPVHNKVKKLEQENMKLLELLEQGQERLHLIESHRIAFHGEKI